MFNLLSAAFQGSTHLLASAVNTVKSLPDLASDAYAPYDVHGIPAALAGVAAAQTAHALSATAHFAVAVTGSALNLAWTGLTTYGPPLAQGTWTGLKTYGPPAAEALGKGTVWLGANAWEAAKWGGSALSAAAEQHQVKERVIALGQELGEGAAQGLTTLAGRAVDEGLPALAALKKGALDTGKALLAETQAGWQVLSGQGIDLGPLDDIGLHTLAAPEYSRQAMHAGDVPLQSLEPELADSGAMAPDSEQPEVWHMARSHWSLEPELDFGQGAVHWHIDAHIHVCLTGATPSSCMQATVVSG